MAKSVEHGHPDGCAARAGSCVPDFPVAYCAGVGASIPIARQDPSPTPRAILRSPRCRPTCSTSSSPPSSTAGARCLAADATPPTPRPIRQHRPEDLHRWLTTLAENLRDAGTRDWLWWELAQQSFSTPRARLALRTVAGLTVGLSVALVTGGAASQQLGLAVPPRHANLQLSGRIPEFLKTLARGLTFTLSRDRPERHELAEAVVDDGTLGDRGSRRRIGCSCPGCRSYRYGWRSGGSPEYCRPGCCRPGCSVRAADDRVADDRADVLAGGRGW